VVFFAFDRSEISPVAATVLERAISDFKENGLTRIVVEGHADRSGTDAYNENLSRARAQAVATFLMGHGVATDNIETAWFGESRPRVQTDDGVRNEENRRAEIFLRR
jgi:outer membrane protein OmpA-like peptidoglycan-associated protein